MSARKGLLFNLALLASIVVVGQNARIKGTFLNQDGVEVKLNEKGDEKPLIVLFYSTDCPICQKYTLPLREMSADYRDKADFLVVYSGKQRRPEELRNFAKRYEFELPSIIDSKYKISRKLGAEITPEAFVIDEGEIIYHGAIDDWVIRLGAFKTSTQEYFLRDAIDAAIKGETPEKSYAQATGCFIK